MSKPVQHGPAREGSPSARLAFNGELLESSTDVYVLGNGYRAYSPLLMIFFQPDSWSPFGAGGLNAYAYCAGDPVNATDPTGHMPYTSLFRPWRMGRSPSPRRYNLPPVLPVLSEENVVPTLAGFASHPVPGSSAWRVSPPPIQAATAPAVSQSRSALLTPAGSAGPSGGVLRPNHRTVDYKRLETEIERMTPSNDAEGIIRLSEEPFSKAPVLRELLWQLLRDPGESRPVYSRRAQAPKLRQGDLVLLEDGARHAGTIEKAQFYANLRHGLFTPQRRRTTPRAR